MAQINILAYSYAVVRKPLVEKLFIIVTLAEKPVDCKCDHFGTLGSILLTTSIICLH